MLRDYLKDQRQVFVLDDETIEVRLGEIQTKRIEDKKFLELLRSEGDVFFTDFTPRDVNNKNIVKIRELEADLVDLQKEEDSLLQRKRENANSISFMDDCISEYMDLRKNETKLQDLRAEYENLKTVNNVDDYNNEEQKKSVSADEDSAGDEIKDLDELEAQLAMVKRTIGRILNFLPTAPMRARDELVKLQREL